LIHQVTFAINQSAFGVHLRCHIKLVDSSSQLALDSGDLESCEREYFHELSKLQFHMLENSLALLSHNVSFRVDQVTFFVHNFADFVRDLRSILVLNYITFFIFVEDTNYIMYVESPALKIE
jgi:hypothetical protein